MDLFRTGRTFAPLSASTIRAKSEGVSEDDIIMVFYAVQCTFHLYRS